VIDTERRPRAVGVFAVGIPAYLLAGVVFLMSGLPLWTAGILFGVAMLDAVWLVLGRSR
jgi:hypothetical protein